MYICVSICVYIWLYMCEILDTSLKLQIESGNSIGHIVTWYLQAHILLGTCQERMTRTYTKRSPFLWNTLKRNNVFIWQFYIPHICILLTSLKVNKIYKQYSLERQNSKILGCPLKIICWWHILQYISKATSLIFLTFFFLSLFLTLNMALARTSVHFLIEWCENISLTFF